MDKKIVISLFAGFFYWGLYGQASNTSCANPFVIEDPVEWCSGEEEFDNTDAGPSEFGAIGCFEGEQNDLWFEFTAFAKAVNIVVNGDLSGIGGLRDPQLALYSGICAEGELLSQLECDAANTGPDVANIFQGGLTIGEKYLIRVGGRGDFQGTFQLCINNYNPPVEPGQDAETASILCDKSSFVVQVLSGGGVNSNEAIGTCLDISGDSENQSSWLSWIAANDGFLTFTITPLNPGDDIDFVLYEFPNGIDDSSGKIALRCMASSCVGPTGLDATSTDLEEDLGCEPDEDGFIRGIDMEAGKAYGLLINNFTESFVGYEISFGGDGEFVGPEPAFSVDVELEDFVCDRIFQIEDNSDPGIGMITDYEWNFGAGAIPQTAFGPGPHSVVYESFGEKFIALTVTSELGCIVTEVTRIEVERCCDENNTLDVVLADAGGVVCEGDEDGFLSIEGIGGAPDYLYSFEGSEFSRNAIFEGLPVGSYEVGVLDIKGCETFRIFEIENAPPILVDAGEDQSVEILGESTMLNGSVSVEGPYGSIWSPGNGLSCTDGSLTCLDPTVTPPGTTTYTLLVTDQYGCTAADSVTITVINMRPVYAPNVFSPNEDGINDVFSILGNTLAVVSIEELLVFDRWGNKVYEAFNLPVASATTGWDGRINGRPAQTGVYTWVAKVVFIDNLEGESEFISGDVTLLR